MKLDDIRQDKEKWLELWADVYEFLSQCLRHKRTFVEQYDISIVKNPAKPEYYGLVMDQAMGLVLPGYNKINK